VGRLVWVLLCLALAWRTAEAARIDRLDVEREGDAYRVVMDATIDAPTPAVWAVLTDLAHLGKLSPAFREVKLLDGGPAGTERVRTLTRFCALFICRNINQVQDFSRPGPRRLHALVDPAVSDLREGEADWRLRAQGGGARLLFESRIVPRFWVPPLIGPWMIRRSLAEQAQVVLASLERIARRQAR